jgi:hypothetical protein
VEEVSFETKVEEIVGEAARDGYQPELPLPWTCDDSRLAEPVMLSRDQRAI